MLFNRASVLSLSCDPALGVRSVLSLIRDARVSVGVYDAASKNLRERARVVRQGVFMYDLTRRFREPMALIRIPFCCKDRTDHLRAIARRNKPACLSIVD